MSGAELLLVYEAEKACRERLSRDGFAERAALEISSYLAQSTDLAREFGAIERACAERGLRFRPVELDDAVSAFATSDPDKTMVWTLTDGSTHFRGGASPGLARLSGLATFGSDDSLFTLCQDKFRSGAVLAALDLPVPPAGMARNGTWLADPPEAGDGWFVKPNRLGAKIGIWSDSHCRSLDHALELSRRIFAAYRDDAVVQPYVPGRNVRASFLAVEPETGVEALGVAYVEAGGDFQTMDESMALYGETGEAAKAEGSYREPELMPVASRQPEADVAVRRIAKRLMAGLGLRDVFSLDARIEEDGAVHLIEFEVCPGLPCFDFRAYCASQWGMSLADAIAETAVRRMRR